MKQTILGNSDLSITTLGFGAWAIGGLGSEYAWGPQDLFFIPVFHTCFSYLDQRMRVE